MSMDDKAAAADIPRVSMSVEEKAAEMHSIQTRDDRQVQKIEFAKIVLSHKKELFGDGEDGMGNSRCNGETKEEVWKKIEAEVQHLPIYKVNLPRQAPVSVMTDVPLFGTANSTFFPNFKLYSQSPDSECHDGLSPEVWLDIKQEPPAIEEIMHISNPTVDANANGQFQTGNGPFYLDNDAQGAGESNGQSDALRALSLLCCPSSSGIGLVTPEKRERATRAAVAEVEEVLPRKKGRREESEAPVAPTAPSPREDHEEICRKLEKRKLELQVSALEAEETRAREKHAIEMAYKKAQLRVLLAKLDASEDSLSNL